MNGPGRKQDYVPRRADEGGGGMLLLSDLGVQHNIYAPCALTRMLHEGACGDFSGDNPLHPNAKVV